MSTLNKGFTIVELLIVIVVIAILASISIVAYTSISGSAHDSVIKSDLSNMAKKFQLVYAETGVYPAGGRTGTSSAETGNSTLFPGFTHSVTKSSYGAVSPTSLGYCTDGGAFRILALSKSGKYFEFSSARGLVDLGTSFVPIYGHLRLCEGFDYPRTFSYANSSTSSSITSWNAWAN